MNSQLFQALANITRFNEDNFTSCAFYNHQNRDADHMLWLWTLHLVSMSLFFMLKYQKTKILTYVIEFIKRFQTRITMI